MTQHSVIAVLSHDSSITERIEASCRKLPVTLFVFTDSDRFVEFIHYELPEITVYNLLDSSPLAGRVLEEVRKDPWLHYGGIIGVCLAEEQDQVLESLKDTNLLALIPEYDLDYLLPRVLTIVRKQRQILFQRHIQKEFLTDFSGSFLIDNDPFDLTTYSHLVTNYLFNAGLINADARKSLHVALMELLFNAVEHGNCAISSEEKTSWLGDHKDIIDLIRRKNSLPAVRRKKVQLRYSVTHSMSTFTIRDQGRGFDWRKKRSADRDAASFEELSLHGRGIIMATHFVEGLSYNEKGNEVSFQFPHSGNREQLFPRLFSDHQKLIFNDGEVVFRENDESNHLYFIASGNLRVSMKGKKLSFLTPADVFVGEMSFLLNNRRTATVVSAGQSVLLRISKKEFLTAMRNHPHYSIFLARLLAQRLQRLNRTAVNVV
ncbi:MAG TPA: cyclic nucleotide-binding domain-containing protein [Spirochaetia bacterium]|nr:cyclic nucleotide-binding domain-containing protein [Spirochaetia bacterium]